MQTTATTARRLILLAILLLSLLLGSLAPGDVSSGGALPLDGALAHTTSTVLAS